jgi:hypothetical protein
MPPPGRPSWPVYTPEAAGATKAMDDETFRKSLRLLAHPAALAAVGLLLLNDHALRRLWPSWLTGKLGDFAWLFFIPFVAAALLALLIPRRLPGRDRLVGLLAFGLAGGIFALAKTVSPFHALVVRWAGAVFGFPVGWRRDPADLVALGSLALAWWLWQRTESRPAPRLCLGWIMLPLAGLLTMANAPAPDPGIYCLAPREGYIAAFSAYSSFASNDGGLTWEPAAFTDAGRCPDPWSAPASTTPEVIVDPSNAAIQYRFTPGQAIERSEDGGQAWHVDLDLRPAGEAERAYYEKRHAGSPVWREAPLAGLVDPRTGNAVFAMGHAGVLVRRADGSWARVSVGGYAPMSAGGAGAVLSLLVGEMLLAAGLGLLAISTLWLARHKGTFRKVLLGIGWAAWGLSVVVFRPAFQTGYAVAIVWALLVATGLVAIALAADALFRAFGSAPRAAWRMLVVAVVGALLFILPYLLWATGGLPSYNLAIVFALMLSAATLYAGYRWTMGLSQMAAS